MSETRKFEVIDRRKIKAREEQEGRETPAQEAPAEPVEAGGGPRLVTNESRREAEAAETGEASGPGSGQELSGSGAELPPAPTAEESKEQKAAYEASAQRLEDLIRAQDPGVGAPPAVSFEHLVQQLYVTAMIQMGAAAQEGQRPQIDIMGARNTIDIMGVLAEKTRGNLTKTEEQTLQSVLFELRMAFLELTGMVKMQGVQAPPPGKV